jgi:carbonic anhydrase/acetyltransferase-like protein (isoleucine patch superfamily)
MSERSLTGFRRLRRTHPERIMGLCIPIRGIHPQMPAFLAPNATLVGDVRFGPECSVWFGAVLRADLNYVSLGARCNVQDLCCLHVTKLLPCVLEDEVSLGHGVIAHGCTIGAGTLVGMGARILDRVRIGQRCIVAAGCVVPEGMEVPDGHLVAGVPGKVLKALSPEQQERIAPVAGNYVAYQQLYPELFRHGT